MLVHKDCGQITSLRHRDIIYHIDNTLVYQNNQSAILLEKNGEQSLGKPTKYMNI